jgi:hypothetical protein
LKKHFLIFVFLLLLPFIGCSVSSVANKQIIFEPANKGIDFTYSDGIPVVNIKTDSSFYVLSLDQPEVAANKYIRLWVLYQNNSNVPVLYKPYNSFELRLQIKQDTSKICLLLPEKPSEILTDIDVENLNSNTGIFLGGVLNSIVYGKNTTVTTNTGIAYTIDDGRQKSAAIIDRTNADMQMNNEKHGILKSDVSSGILRKNTVAPGKSVSGYVYFKLPKRLFAGFRIKKLCVKPICLNYELSILEGKAMTKIPFMPLYSD